MNKPSTIDRFNDSFIPVTECGCWIWIKARTKRGYGSVKVDGVNWRANRLSWTLHKGEIPRGLHVCHRCDIPECVNPDHLFLGTHLENMQDRDRKGRGNHHVGPRAYKGNVCCGDRHWMRKSRERTLGEDNNRAVLSEEDAVFIKTSSLSGSKLAEIFNVTKTHANNIKAGKVWRHLCL